jgi:hypothetical protein
MFYLFTHHLNTSNSKEYINFLTCRDVTISNFHSEYMNGSNYREEINTNWSLQCLYLISSWYQIGQSQMDTWCVYYGKRELNFIYIMKIKDNIYKVTSMGEKHYTLFWTLKLTKMNS